MVHSAQCSVVFGADQEMPVGFWQYLLLCELDHSAGVFATNHADIVDLTDSVAEGVFYILWCGEIFSWALGI